MLWKPEEEFIQQHPLIPALGLQTQAAEQMLVLYKKESRGGTKSKETLGLEGT